MNLTLKQKALAQTVAMIGGAILIASALSFILNNVSTQTILDAVAYAGLAWVVYIFYSITLARLEYNESLKELKKTFEEK